MVHHVVSGSPTAYAVVFAIVAIDALVPFAQAEAVVVTAAVLAAQGHLNVWLIVLAAALGGLAGDNASYLLGSSIGCRAAGKLVSRRRLQRARRGLHRRGGVLIMVARFIPVGRSVTTFAAGTLEMPWRRFLAVDAVAAALWAGYATCLGYVGGASFADSLWKPLAVALGIALLVTTAGEVYRHIQRHRGKDILSGHLR
jgi:membrane protein DedA with SNARE-associated domain